MLTIEDDAFRGCKEISYVIIPRSVSYIGDGAFAECTALESIVVDKKNKRYRSKNNCLIEAKGKKLILGCKSSEICDGSVESIDWFAFSGCEALLYLDIPSSVTSVDERAFIGCTGIEYISVSRRNKVYYCEGECLIEAESGRLVLGCKSSEIPDDGSVTSIGPYSFYGRANQVVLPDGVRRIEYSAFANSPKFVSVDIPSSVTFIDDRAFGDCDDLHTIHFGGTIAEWTAVEKVDGWCEGVPGDLKIVCLDGNAEK